MSQTDSFPPWTLKQVPTEQRNAAIKAAERAHEPIGRWVGRVIHEAAMRELAPSRRQVLDLATQPPAPETMAVQAAAAETILRLAQAAQTFAGLPTDTRALRGVRNAGLRVVRQQAAAQ